MTEVFAMLPPLLERAPGLTRLVPLTGAAPPLLERAPGLAGPLVVTPVFGFVVFFGFLTLSVTFFIIF